MNFFPISVYLFIFLNNKIKFEILLKQLKKMKLEFYFYKKNIIF